MSLSHGAASAEVSHSTEPIRHPGPEWHLDRGLRICCDDRVGYGGQSIDTNGDHTRRHLVAVAMAQLIEFAVGGGQAICVQVEGSAAGPVTRGIGGQSITTRASQTFEEAISRVRPAAEAVVAQMRSLASAPDEVAVEFGMTLSAGAGAFIAAVSTEANFKVSLTWHRPAAQEAR